MRGALRVLVGAAIIAGGLATTGLPASAETKQGPVNHSCGPRIDTPKKGDDHDHINGPGYRVLLLSEDNVYKGRRVWFVWGYGLRPGDKVSLDWSDNSGATYHACHGTVHRGHRNVQTWAVDDPGTRSFRMCLKRRGEWTCGEWM